MVAAIVILSVLVGVLGYLLYINFRRAERAEEYCEAYIRFTSALFFRFRGTRDKMKEIDRLGAFQADDEVGSIFKQLDESVEDLYEFITKYVNTETEENKKAKD